MTNKLLSVTTYKLAQIGVDEETARTLKAIEAYTIKQLGWVEAAVAYGTTGYQMATLNPDYIKHIKDKLRGN